MLNQVFKKSEPLGSIDDIVSPYGVRLKLQVPYTTFTISIHSLASTIPLLAVM